MENIFFRVLKNSRISDMKNFYFALRNSRKKQLKMTLKVKNNGR